MGGQIPDSSQAGAKTDLWILTEGFLTTLHSWLPRAEWGLCHNEHLAPHKTLLTWVKSLSSDRVTPRVTSLYALPTLLGQVRRYLVRDYEADLIGSGKNFYTCCNLGGFPAEQLFGRPKLKSKSAGNLTPFSNCQHSAIIRLIKIDVSTTWQGWRKGKVIA